MIKRAERIRPIGGFGIDRVAAAAEETGGRHGCPILRMENLDTDLPLPPEALEMTRTKLDDPRSNSWLPFTGDLDLRAAISDFTVERSGHRYDPEREIVVTAGGLEALLDVLLCTVDPGDEVIVTYEATKTGGRRFRNTEVLTFDGDRICKAEVYFGWNLE